MDWRLVLNSSSAKDQGDCGSCWAVAAVGALETHAEIAARGQVPQLSFEMLVDCVQNPEECGGSGGCNGATAELGFEYVQERGLAAAADYQGYQALGDSGYCKPVERPPVLRTQGYVRLPENKVQPLLQAIAF